MWGAHNATRMLMISRRRQACDTAVGPSTGARYQDRWREKKVRACHPQRTLNTTRFTAPAVPTGAVRAAPRQCSPPARAPQRPVARPPSLASEGAPAGAPPRASVRLGDRGALAPAVAIACGRAAMAWGVPWPNQGLAYEAQHSAQPRWLPAGGWPAFSARLAAAPLARASKRRRNQVLHSPFGQRLTTAKRSVLWVGRWQN